MYEPKDIFTGEQLDTIIRAGVKGLTDPVKSTLGPGGMPVILGSETGRQIITKDGVSVAKAIYLKDRDANSIAQILKEAAIRINDTVGDGTTTVTTIAGALVENLLNFAKVNRVCKPVIKRTLDQLTPLIIEVLEEDLIRPEEVAKEHIRAIAQVSSNGDESIIEKLTEIYTTLGKDCMVLVNNEIASVDKITYYKGAYLEKGYLSPYFINNRATKSCQLENGNIYVTDYEFNESNMEKWLPKISLYLKKNDGKPLAILAKDFDEASIELFTKIARDSTSTVIPMRGIATGDTAIERLRDIAVLCSTYVSADIEDFDKRLFGAFESIIIGQRETIIKGVVEEEVITEYINDLISSSEVATSAFQKNIILERVASLRGGWAIYDVGGSSSLERKERYDRVVDAKFAVRNAMHYGIVPGGSRAIVCAVSRLFDRLSKHESELIVNVLYEIKSATIECYKQIFRNYGYNEVDFTSADPSYNCSGWDSSTAVSIHDIYESVSPIDIGLYDPYNVIQEIIKTAISVAGILITTSYLVIPTSYRV